MQPFAKTCNRFAMFLVILFRCPRGFVLLSGYSFPQKTGRSRRAPGPVLSRRVATATSGDAVPPGATLFRSGHALLSREPQSDQEADTIIRVAVSDTFSIALPAFFWRRLLLATES